MAIEIRHPFKRERKRSQLGPFEKTRTKQQFAKECDINQIMKKFHKSGILTHLAKYGAAYGDATGTDLLDAMNTLTQAQEMYDALPSEVRRNFAGPEQFLDYVQDDENVEQLRKWGLAKPHQEDVPILVRVQQDPDPGPDPDPEPEPD